MKKICISIVTMMLLNFNIAKAEKREIFEVTGTSTSSEGYQSQNVLEYLGALADAKEQAFDICLSEGYTRFVTVRVGDPENRFFGGKSVKLHFYCL